MIEMAADERRVSDAVCPHRAGGGGVSELP